MFVIEFMGGPFDGRQQFYRVQPARLPVDLVWLVCDDSWSRPVNVHARRHGKLTSVALYSLETQSDATFYRFAGAISPLEFMRSFAK